ncbi:hypothetical protein [Kitasatospora purpeofusca]|uniref:hypothetical protein n=1 Tax=Kitasatospora purpeofusca TaxID=67352 RepID=UPI00056D7DCE|nr:hypothetical protein [Kitasatospora purpeofusca]
MTTPDQQLRTALDALDAAFAALPESPISVGGCTHCYTGAELETLAGPAHGVPDDLVRSVATEVPDHWDDFAALYRRTTPRIVRLLTTGRLHGGYGLVASRLLAAGYRGWPPPERQALERVWDAWWRSTLGEYPGTDRATEVLETVAVCTGSLSPWLTVWTETRTEAAERHFEDALDIWLAERGLADLRLGFYRELLAGPELVTWLLAQEEGRIGAAQLFEVERIAYS